jgi:hypothetical protein
MTEPHGQYLVPGGPKMPQFGISAAMANARLQAALGPCAHPNAVPVEALVTGERVAALCPDCDTQLPAEWEPVKPSITDMFYDPSLVRETRR